MPGPSVELSMIVKDGGAGLRRCLESVRPLVKRMVMGDTGSTDGSMELARSLGAEVVSVPWTNDYSAARNVILKRAQSDWILVLDADEMLDVTAGEHLRKAVANPEVMAYDVCRWNYVSSGSSRSAEEGALANLGVVEASRAWPAYVRSWNTRLFRRHPKIYFERPVHETVAATVDALGFKRPQAGFIIHHFGQVEDPAAARRGKSERYQQIGRAYQQTNPSDARTAFELGLGELEHFRRPKEALAYFTQAVNLDQKDASAWLFAGICLVRLGHLKQAVPVLEQSKRLNPTSIVLQDTLGDAHFHVGEYAKARVEYGHARALGGVSALIEAKLGVCEIYLGRKDLGMAMVREAVGREPDFAELRNIESAAALLANHTGAAGQSR